MHRYGRKLERFYTHSPYVAEFWNTLSNLPFVIIGVLRLWEGADSLRYGLYTLAGLASAFHHASSQAWTIVVDWIPIATSLAFSWQAFFAMTPVTAFLLLLALSTLAADHIWTPTPVPWGHVMWHLLAAIAVDRLYQDYVPTGV